MDWDVSPDGKLSVDILTRLGTAFGYSDLAFSEEDIGETTVRVATPRTLYDMKVGTVRDVDRLDAYWDAVRALLKMTAALSPPWFSPGVRKYRSVEEANEARARWEREAGQRRLASPEE